MTGKTFYVISVGAGNPKWLTLEAVEWIKDMDVIAVPAPHKEKRSQALTIAKDFVSDKEILYLELPMTYDREILQAKWKTAAEKVYKKIKSGRKTGMLVLGDATLFGTGNYIVRALKEIDDKITIKIAPGVISPTACAAQSSRELAMGDENLVIIPDSENNANLDKAFRFAGTVVLMKISRSLQSVISYLDEKNLSQNAYVVIKAGTPRERIINNISELKGKKLPYMSLMIVKNTPPEDTVRLSPCKGKLFIVGIGPGNREYMTFRAEEAIRTSEVVIGYKKYLELVEDLLAGKEVISGSMTEEIERAIKSVETAKKGKIVSLISSGDAGVYGMTSPVYELLKNSGWRPGDNPDVEVIPGITAVNSVSSLLGSPLSHDYCSISLSDLLTPWEVIKKRLVAAAESDMICGLYNPKSKRRTEQLLSAQKIFLKYRNPDTPVGIVKSAYRKLQSVNITTLDRIQDHDVGMLSTIIIGNSSTVNYEGIMITPRGYERKYHLW